MISGIQDKYLKTILLFSVPFIGLLITPWISADPVNQSKMTLLVPTALASTAILFSNFRNLLPRFNKYFLVLISLFLSQLILVLVFSPAPFNQQFYGTFGRNTGFLTSFLLLALAASYVSSLDYISKMSFALIFTGVISASYCSLQTINADPIKWSNPYNAIVGFLGNPNFASSFLAITALACFGLFLKPRLGMATRAAALFYIFWSLVLIVRSNSQQGIMVLGGGAVVTFLLFLIGNKKLARKIFIIPYLLTVSIVGTIVLFAMLNHGPLANYIYKLSVRQRGFYWNAAIEMMKTHPIFGVGLDSYGDWYLGLRSANAAFHTPNITSNEAHNVFLNLGATGGFPLFLLSIALTLVTAWSIFKYLRRNREFNWAYAGLVGAWVGYVAQSIISISQIGLAIWGWILMGLLIGVEHNSKPESDVPNVNNSNQKFTASKKLKKNAKDSQMAISFGGIGFLIGLFVALPVFVADSNFRSGLESKSAEKFIESALANPRDNSRIVQAAQILAQSNLIEQSKDLVAIVLENNPRHYNAWELKLQLEDPMKDPNSQVAKEIKNKLRELNPRVTID
jgi:O-antigen ligase